jgi:hypothetical protein
MPHFFDEYVPYRQFIDSRQYRDAVDGALHLMESVKQLAPQQFAVAHKGSPFYILGFAAFASHDYSTASLYFDAAVEEDLTNHPGRNDMAALLFMQLADNGVPLLAQSLVAQIAEDMNVLIRDYNARPTPQARPMTLNDLRNFFLTSIIKSNQRHERALVTALISFVAEWRYRRRLMELVAHGSREPFFLHLFRGCLLFESLLKHQPKKTLTKTTLGEILRQDLKAELHLNNPDVREVDFNTIVAGMTANMNIEDTINSAGRARNTLGHNIVWATTALNTATYDLLVKNIAASCLHVISNLYR